MADVIKGFGITQHRVAVAIGVPPRRINEIVHGSRCISADTASAARQVCRHNGAVLARSAESVDLDVAQDGVAGQIEAIVPSRRRGRTFVAWTYFSPILLNSALRRMGEKYVHVGKVRGCSTPSGRREKRARRTPGRLCPKTVVWRTSATPVMWEEGGTPLAFMVTDTWPRPSCGRRAASTRRTHRQCSGRAVGAPVTSLDPAHAQPVSIHCLP